MDIDSHVVAVLKCSSHLWCRFETSETAVAQRRYTAMTKEIMTTEEAAQYLQVHPETLRSKVRAGEVPAAKVGRAWRFRKADLDEWLAKGGTLVAAHPPNHRDEGT